MYLPMAKVPPIVNLSAEDQAQLARRKSTQARPQQVALRCRLALAAAEAYPDLRIAPDHEAKRHTVARRHYDTRREAERNRHALRRAQCIGRQSHRTVQWPASPSRIPEVPAPPGLGLSRGPGTAPGAG